MVHSVLLRSAFGVSWESSMNRVHTSEFVQVFGSKIQDFSQTFFSKTMTSFSRLKVLKYVIYRDLKKTQEQSFFFMSFRGTLQK